MRESGFIQIISILVVLLLIAVFAYPAVKGVISDITSFTKTTTPPKSSSPKIIAPIRKQQPEVKIPSVIKEEEEKKEPDSVSPKRFNPKPSGNLEPGSLKTVLGLETDERATCRYGTIKGLGYGDMKPFDNTGEKVHWSEITTIISGTSYIFYARCEDQSANKNEDDFSISFLAPSALDAIPPELKYPYPQGETLKHGTKEVTMTISTNEAASCSFAQDPEGSYSGFSSDQYSRYHYTNLTGLSDGKTYDYFVRCCDTSNNCRKNFLIRFNVAP